MSLTDNETLSWRNPGADVATIDLEVYGFSGAENQYDMRITLENCGEAPFNGMDDGELRLADGPDENSGRLEVFLNGEWGTCDDQFGQEDANVACRQLGFAGAERVSSFGAGEGLIHMDDVGYIGDEARLIDCAHLDSDQQTGHFEDVGVVCLAEERGSRSVVIAYWMPEKSVTTAI